MTLHFTRHASERMAQMNVTEDEVRSGVEHPVLVERTDMHAGPATRYFGRRIGAIVDPDDNVITVLWTDPEAAEFLQPGRRPRKDHR